MNKNRDEESRFLFTDIHRAIRLVIVLVYLLWFNMFFGLNFLKPVYFFQTNLFFFFQTSSIIEVECKDDAVVRTLASRKRLAAILKKKTLC